MRLSSIRKPGRWLGAPTTLLSALTILIPLFGAACGAASTKRPWVPGIQGGTGIEGVGETTLIPLWRDDDTDPPKMYREALDAVGLMGPFNCTGVHIGNGIVLTAGHCLSGPKFAYGLEFPMQDFTDSPEDCYYQKSPQSRRQRVGFRWGYLAGDNGGNLESLCVSILAAEYQSQGTRRDFAIVKVRPKDMPKIGIPVVTGFRPPQVTVLGYPCDLDKDFNCIYAGPMQWSDFCAADKWDGPRFEHECTTRKGNSGSPILAELGAPGNATVVMVGLHDGAGDPVQNGVRIRWNYATSLSDPDILALLQKVGAPIVQYQSPPSTQPSR